MVAKVGIGYDIHELVKGRDLILGGIKVPYEKGLDGHSDADVLLHAVCDALLGALGKGDIGEHFPNTDEQYRNISSLILLEKVNELLQQEGFFISNIDSVVLAEEPKINMYKSKMRAQIAKTLSVAEEKINIKATTMEGLGFSSGKQGIAVYAVALLTKENVP